MKNVAKLFILLMMTVVGVHTAEGRVFTVPSSQKLISPFASPDNPFFSSFDFAIDGDSIVIITGTGDGAVAAALLYRRATNGQWIFSRELYRETVEPGSPTPTVVMKNSLAVIKIGAEATFWERAGGGWRRAATAERILGNELSASLNGTVLARAIDNDIPTGQFGVGTYRASAEFTSIFVSQP